MRYVASFGNYSKERYNINEHKVYEIIYYSSGSGKLDIEGKKYEVEKGTIVVIPPKFKHGSISYDNLSYIYVSGDLDGLISLESPAILKDNERGDGLSLLQIILYNRLGDQEYFNSLCIAYVHFVLKNVKITNPIEKAVYKIKRQIRANLHDCNLNVTDFLNDSGYAEDYIRAHFRKIVGKTPVAFLTELRIKNAITLINLYQNSMPLMEIATHCGFEDYIYFSRSFKKITGLSPQAYKNSLLSDNK